ncbi:heme ABC transporter ATP-binding protein [Corynebacterium sp.]|uniref:heme ABC transporter ATP-binding protein n=1 Tax=Corynebacterium sp. TaxID=1720 RepID=UPI0026DBBA46|nr:heme ABC transporter ATP-binding protein [Corynebacterium sp.]MDO5077141.1 heme ABC transporter ATP-binding protein [Corynebacterium sp.]
MSTAACHGSAVGLTPLLQARHVRVTVGGRTLLDDVSLDAYPGEVLGLIGPNGAGKSTLLAAMSGDLRLDAGEVSVCGLNAHTASHLDLARRRSVMLQDVSVSFAFLVRDVVAMGRRPWSRTSYDQCDESLIDAALAATGVAHLAERDIMTLSGGERSRVALSRVLAQQTPVVLLDEPTAALDIGHQEQALGLIRGMARGGAAVVIVLHDLQAAAAYCDRILCLAGGKVAAYGSTQQVFVDHVLSSAYGWPIRIADSPDGGGLRIVPESSGVENLDVDALELLKPTVI